MKTITALAFAVVLMSQSLLAADCIQLTLDSRGPLAAVYQAQSAFPGQNMANFLSRIQKDGREITPETVRHLSGPLCLPRNAKPDPKAAAVFLAAENALYSAASPREPKSLPLVESTESPARIQRIPVSQTITLALGNTLTLDLTGVETIGFEPAGQKEVKVATDGSSVVFTAQHIGRTRIRIISRYLDLTYNIQVVGVKAAASDGNGQPSLRAIIAKYWPWAAVAVLLVTLVSVSAGTALRKPDRSPVPPAVREQPVRVVSPASAVKPREAAVSRPAEATSFKLVSMPHAVEDWIKKGPWRGSVICITNSRGIILLACRNAAVATGVRYELCAALRGSHTARFVRQGQAIIISSG